ncbi:MAG: hypothetical protein ACHQUA_00160 [Microgenomates group bacterium]
MERPPYFTFAPDFLKAIQRNEIEQWVDRAFPGSFEKFPFKIREIFPSINAMRSPILNFEILGHERSGKSTFIEHLKQTGIEGAHVIVQPEFSVGNHDRKFSKFAKKVLSNRHYAGSDVDWSILKLMSTDAAIAEANDLAQKMDAGKIKRQPIVVVTERGPQDTLAYSLYNSLLGWSDDGDLTGRYQKAVPINAYFVAILYSELVTSSVFFQNSIETAMHRRELDGLPKEGYMVTPKVRELVDRVYGSWLGQIYPALRRTHGAGLKVIDGERSIEENNKSALGYLSQIVSESKSLS